MTMIRTFTIRDPDNTDHGMWSVHLNDWTGDDGLATHFLDGVPDDIPGVPFEETSVQDGLVFPPRVGWTVRDGLMAVSEGWDIFDCEGTLQLCRCDYLEVFPSDAEAQAHDSPTITKAKAFLANYSPQETPTHEP